MVLLKGTDAFTHSFLRHLVQATAKFTHVQNVLWVIYVQLWRHLDYFNKLTKHNYLI